jgi:NAD(P)H dehydrogenase (quinone)
VKMLSIIQTLLIYGMVIVGDAMSATGHYGVACVGAPDPRCQENGTKLGQRAAGVAAKLQPQT